MKCTSRFATFAIPVLLALSVGACRAKGHSPFEGGSVKKTSPTSVAASARTTPPLTGIPKLKPEQFAVPVGPPLAVLPGRGLGPIRFGASLATIERLIDAKCTTVSTTTENGVEKQRCAFAFHAFECELEGGKLTRVRINGSERRFPGSGGPPGGTWGIFKGGLDGAALGMYAAAVIEELGQPSSVVQVEPAKDPAQGYATVMRHSYPHNTLLEYDKLANNNVVLAGIVLEPDPEAIQAARLAALAAAAPSPSAAPTNDESKSPGSGKARHAKKKPVKAAKAKP